MDSYQLAEQLLELPKGNVEASVDIDTGCTDKDGDTIISKLFASSIAEVFTRRTADGHDVTIQFELSSGGGEGVDVIEAVKEAQKKHGAQSLIIGNTYYEHTISTYANEQNYQLSKVGVKQSGGNFIILKESKKVIMSFMLVGDRFQRIY